MDFAKMVGDLKRNAVSKGGDAGARQQRQDALRGMVSGMRTDRSSAAHGTIEKRLTDWNVQNPTHHGVRPEHALHAVHKRFPKTHLEYEFQKAADVAYMTNFLMKATGQRGLPRDSRAYQNLQYMRTELQKALTLTNTSDFIPTDLSSTLHEIVRLQLLVAALHPRMTMPTNPWEMPLEGVDVEAFLTGEATTDNTSTEANKIGARTPTSSKITWDAVKLAVRSVWSSEIDQDSIIGIGDYVRRKLGQALANGQETATINGDSQGAHQDSDITLATAVQKAWDGYRLFALAGGASVDALNAVPTVALLRSVRAAMGKYGVNPSELAWVVGIKTFNDLLNIDEVLTIEKYGGQATILTGELARIDGIPIVVSEFEREDLNATGVHDGVTTNRTSAQLVRHQEFAYGDRLQIETKSAEVIETDQLVVVTKQRLDFQPLQDTSSEDIVGTLFNLPS